MYTFLRALSRSTLFVALFVSYSVAQHFSAPVSFSTDGFGPIALALGDLNHDHHLDAVVANENSGTVAVLLSNGDGTFQTPVTFAAGADPFDVVLADFNRDGNLDAAIANRIDVSMATVTILLGDGSGGFGAPVSYGPFLDAFSISTGYVDHDNKLDILVSDTGAGILLAGNGDGTFRAPTVIGVPNAVAIQPLRLDHDGRTGLVSASNLDSTVVTLRSKEHGGFQQTGSVTVSTAPIAMVVGDFNRDGRDDVAVANEIGPVGGNVTILLGNAHSNLSLGAQYAVGPEPRSIATADFNRDGKLDLVTSSPSNTVSVLLGLGNGTFQPAFSVPSGGIFAAGVRTGDVNGDGRPDIVVANPSEGTISVLLGQP